MDLGQSDDMSQFARRSRSFYMLTACIAFHILQQLPLIAPYSTNRLIGFYFY